MRRVQTPREDRQTLSESPVGVEVAVALRGVDGAERLEAAVGGGPLAQARLEDEAARPGDPGVERHTLVPGRGPLAEDGEALLGGGLGVVEAAHLAEDLGARDVGFGDEGVERRGARQIGEVGVGRRDGTVGEAVEDDGDVRVARGALGVGVEMSGQGGGLWATLFFTAIFCYCIDRKFLSAAVMSVIMCILQTLLSIPILFNAETSPGKGPQNHPPYMGPEKVGLYPKKPHDTNFSWMWSVTFAMATGFFLFHLALQKIGYIDPPIDTSEEKPGQLSAEPAVPLGEKAKDDEPAPDEAPVGEEEGESKA
mmetsp:Transcript_14929/g.59882  ORF Transcript_14929/g.59882 Transcript_14929/m.59882 type:complete len:310 (+) Transcript_14929:907-1836(+)